MRGKIRALPDSPMYSIPTLGNREPGKIMNSLRVAFSPSLLCSVHHGVLSVPTRPTAYRRSTIPISQRSLCLRRIPGTFAHGSTVHREPSHWTARVKSRSNHPWDSSRSPGRLEYSTSIWNPLQLGR